MAVKFEVTGIIPAAPEDVYQAWLDTDQHTKMTGSPARVSDQVGDEFEAWVGYIQGMNLKLELHHRIIQSWRTTEFETIDTDSLLEINFEAHEEGTHITIRHSKLPGHGMQYQQGWIDAYFIPMQTFFGS